MGAARFPSRSAASVPAITADQMREVDRRAIENGLELIQMMENAGRSLAAVAIARFAPIRVRVLAGSGGNGGGGLVAARHLLSRGLEVEVSLTRPPDELNGVPAHQWSILSALGVMPTDPAPADLVLDAVIGYSLSGSPIGRAAEIIEWSNREGGPVLSLDNPSGVDVTTGEAHNPTVRADATLTLALPKVGLVGSPVTGDLYLADLTIGTGVYDRMGLAVPVDLFTPGPVVRLT
jgi:NAD(P)H-hydrate epimerase